MVSIYEGDSIKAGCWPRCWGRSSPTARAGVRRPRQR